LHGIPFGSATVANSTVAVDVLHPQRRVEGIGYYGLSNNIATAIGPTIAIYMYDLWHNYDIIFCTALVFSCIGLFINSTLKLSKRDIVPNKRPISFDRFFLVKGWCEGLNMVAFSFSYGIISTYIAIYGKDELGITGGTGFFFMLFAIGLILSRIIGNRTLRQGKIVQNASVGMIVSMFGYLLFAGVHNLVAYYVSALIIGLGNGHMFPAFQNMFINLASSNQRGTANATLLTTWDIGVGCGVLFGGYLAEHLGYESAFWAAWIVNAVGVLFFFLFSRKDFMKNRLR